MSKMLIKSLLIHQRERNISALGGRVYRVGRDGLLYSCVKDQVSVEAGVEEEDAILFLSLPSTFGSVVDIKEYQPELAPAPDLVQVDSPEDDNSFLELLDQKVKVIADALSSGDYDANLPELLRAETQGKTRKGVVAAIEARIEESK